MADLQEQGTVAEGATALHAFTAADTERFVDAVLEIGVLDEGALEGAGGTELVLRTGIQFGGVRREVAATEFAIAAHLVGMDALHRRLAQNAFRSAVAALDTDMRIDLPDHLPLITLENGHAAYAGQADPANDTHAIVQEAAAADVFRSILRHAGHLSFGKLCCVTVVDSVTALAG